MLRWPPHLSYFQTNYLPDLNTPPYYCYPLFSECAAGYYRNGDDCEMCTGLSVKMDAGDDTNCSTECTGISDIPNTNHTACSKLC